MAAPPGCSCQVPAGQPLSQDEWNFFHPQASLGAPKLLPSYKESHKASFFLFTYGTSLNPSEPRGIKTSHQLVTFLASN